MRVGALRDIGFQRMGQAVDAGVGGGALRHAEGQFVVDDGGQRQGAEAGDEHLLIGFGIGDDGEARRLRAGARRGRDADDGHQPAVRLGRHLEGAHPGAGLGRGEDGHGLGGIHRAAAAEADQAIMVAGFQHGAAGLDDGIGRVGHSFAEHVEGDAGRPQRRQQGTFDGTGGDHPGVRDHQRPAEAEQPQHLRHLGNTAAADPHEARRDDGGCHGKSSRGLEGG